MFIFSFLILGSLPLNGMQVPFGQEPFFACRGFLSGYSSGLLFNRADFNGAVTSTCMRNQCDHDCCEFEHSAVPQFCCEVPAFFVGGMCGMQMRVIMAKFCQSIRLRRSAADRHEL